MNQELIEPILTELIALSRGQMHRRHQHDYTKTVHRAKIRHKRWKCLDHELPFAQYDKSFIPVGTCHFPFLECTESNE